MFISLCPAEDGVDDDEDDSSDSGERFGLM
jgi:hypothetical protein